MSICLNKKAFSLLEAVIAIAIFVMFAMGVYGGIQLIFKIIYQSRVRIIETAVLNEQIELVRNLSFYDVGIVNGSPSGLLQRNVTMTRNGIDFLITRTIRNIDDPFDGVIGGTPNDTAPADYKLVDIAIVCTQCGQNQPLTVQTYVAPKLLEGDPTHGALYIEVFDAQAQPVVGATVHIVSTSTTPTYDFEDVTDNDGMLRIVDVAEGTDAYTITVTKPGFTIDGTTLPSDINPHPTKPPASVQAQDVTEISFSIDYISHIDIEAVNTQCQPISSVSFAVRGTHLMGTNPDIYQVDGTYTTNGSGAYSFSSLQWDSYGFSVSGYDLVGTIPDVPFALNPGVTQPVQLVIAPNTLRSLLVMVNDDGLPVANAQVRASFDVYDVTKSTGVGSIAQTDWSGGAGQLDFLDNTRYWSDDNNVDVSETAGDVVLRKIGENYISNGVLESSVIDVGTQAHYVTLEWNPLGQTPEVGVDGLRFQIASSASSTSETWEYVGPDGTASTFYTQDSQTIHEIHEGNQYVRYKVYLHTDDATVTPTLSDVSIVYTNECTPPGQSYFGNLLEGEYTVEITHEGYQTFTTTVPVDGDQVVIVDLVAI
ncbi:MAG: prepilin-type N-terminal cleavage/methylation domain-containing protein [Candidatus Magasanikbacteria bacterium]